MRQNSEIFFSIIIPVYNGEKYIQRCVLSVVDINLKEGNFECIIVDNASTDSTKSICARLVETYPEVKYISTEVKGVSNARNIGINYSKGKYLLFLDVDDYFLKNWNHLLTNVVKNSVADFYIFNFNKIFDDGTLVPIKYNFEKNLKKNVTERFLNSTDMNPCWSRIYKAQLVKENRIFFPTDISIGEDFIFSLDYWKFCKTVDYISEIFLVKEENRNSVMHHLSVEKYLADNSKLYHRKIDYIKEEKLFSLESSVTELHFKFITNLCLQIVINEKSKTERKKMMDYVIHHEHTKTLMRKVDEHNLSYLKRIEYKILQQNYIAVIYYNMKSKFIKMKKKNN